MPKKSNERSYIDNVQGTVVWVDDTWAEKKARNFYQAEGKILMNPTLTKTKLVKACNGKVQHREANQARNLSLGKIASKKEVLEEDLKTAKAKIKDVTKSTIKLLKKNLWDTKLRKLRRDYYKLSQKIARLEHKLNNIKLGKRVGICLGRSVIGDKELLKLSRHSHFGATGSKDELFGNAFRLNTDEAYEQDGKVYVPIYHSKEYRGILILEKVHYLKLRAHQQKYGITVDFYQYKKGLWKCVATLNHICDKPYEHTQYTLGIDYNEKTINWVLFTLKGKNLEIVESGEIDIRPSVGSKQQIEESIRKEVKLLCSKVAAYHGFISYEDLDFSNKKCENRGKRMNRMIHNLATGFFRDVLVKECYKNCIPFYAVNAAYTSLVGGVISALRTELGRDAAACVVIGLRGNRKLQQWLYDLCAKYLNKGGKVRSTRKGMQNETLEIVPNKEGKNHEETTVTLQSIGEVIGSAGDYYALGRYLKSWNEKIYEETTRYLREVDSTSHSPRSMAKALVKQSP